MAPTTKEKKPLGLLIVGTGSPSRQDIIEKLYNGQYELVFVPPDIDERAIRSSDALRLTRRIAEEKMKRVLEIIGKDSDLSKKIQLAEAAFATVNVITFDQVVVWGNEIREKPYDLVQAKQFLRDYSGSTVSTVMTTVCYNYVSKKQAYRQNTTRTFFLEFTPELIDRMLARGHCLRAAGGFVVEDPDLSQCVIRIDPGTVEEVQGFSVRAVNELLVETASPVETPPSKK